MTQQQNSNTMKTANKANIEFTGNDVSKEISLLEYGLLVSIAPHSDGSGTHFCVYRISENAFGTAHINPNDCESLINGKEWANDSDIKGFLSFVGQSKEDWLQNTLCTKFSDLIAYFGTENIMGSDYWPITENEAIDRYL